MEETFRWWLAVEVIGLLALPVAFVLFRRLPDRGYAFAKPLGILITSYFFWLLLSLHVLPNRPGSIVWCLAGLTAVSAVIVRRRGHELREEMRANLPAIIAVEAIFAAVLFAGAHLR